MQVRVARGGQGRHGEERLGEATKQVMVWAGKEGGRGEGRAAVGSGWRWGVAEVAGGRTTLPLEWMVAVRKVVMKAKVWGQALYFPSGRQ